MHSQRNATQRNANQNYILKNNFKFYIFQFFRAFNFLSVFVRFAKIISLIKNSFSKNSLSFAEGVLWERGDSRSNLFSGLLHFVRNDKFKISNDNFNYAFSCALKNKFEIISRNENYAFNHNKYFCRNGNNQIGKSISHSPKASYGNEGNARDKVGQSPSNLFCVDCFASIEARNDKFMVCRDGLFSRNDYGGKFIFGFWSNFNFGFLFNRKTKKNKFMSAHSVGEGEQK